ncbi:MAG: PAS domain S-box protein [Actinomycetota bacterium]|nr:PAS domain S-box protein [Actinomycetota bacterium]
MSYPQNEILVRQAKEALRRSEERFKLLVEGVKDYAIFMLDPQGHVETWNAGARRIKGYEAEEIIGQHFSDFYTDEDIERRYPDEELRVATAEGTYEDEGLRVRKDGSTFWANVVITALRDDGGNLRGFAKVTRDITERREAAERERLLAQEQAARRQTAEILESISDAFYAVDRDWRFTYVNRKAEELWGRSREGLLGKHISEEFPQAVGSKSYRQLKRAAEEQATIVFEAKFLVLGTCLAARAYPSQKGLSVYFQDITERKRAEDTQRFLAETGDVLSSSLDYRTTLASVARLAVPTLADWCAVDVLEEDGSLGRLAVEHPDPEKVALAYELEERYPPDPDAPGGVHHVLRTGGTEMMSEIPEELVDQAAHDERHRELLRRLQLRSYMIVPLVARGRTLGAISLVAAESGRRYGEADLALARELARRAALAVDNARLYEEAQREIAQRRRAQEELRASRDELEIIFRGVADGIIAQDASGRLFYANETAARMSGYSSARELVEAPAEEVMSRFELLDDRGLPFPLERLPGRRALRGEDEIEEVLRFRIVETGEERWSVVRAAPVFDEEGRARMAVSIMRDITEQRRAEEAMREVREAERARVARDLHDGVLQDLSYTAAAMQIVMLKAEGTDLAEDLQKAIDAIRRAAQGLRDAVNDLRLEESYRPFPQLVSSLVERSRSMNPGCNIRLEVQERFPPEPLGDVGVELSRVIQEALTNARRHSAARNVLVRLVVDGDILVTEVVDDGRGYDPETPPGMGLRGMRERALRLGGDLQVESAPSEGTRVRIRLPMHVALRAAPSDEFGAYGEGR